MQIRVNGEPVELPEPSTVQSVLDHFELGDAPCAVEVNRDLVPKRHHGSHAVADGDEIEIVTLVGGG